MSYIITPLPVKFELRGYGEVHDVSNNIDNWREIEVVLSRDGASGVFHELSFPFEFVLEAYDVVKRWFEANMYRASGDVYIYLRRDDWVYNSEKYNEPQVFSLDFTSYEETDTKIEINTKRVSLFDYLKSKRKVVYDIPVEEIREDKKWYFDRIEMENTANFLCANELGPGRIYSGNQLLLIGISIENSEISVPDVIFTKTIGMNIEIPRDIQEFEDYYFAYLSDKKESAYVHLSFELRVQGGFTTAENNGDLYVRLNRGIPKSIHGSYYDYLATFPIPINQVIDRMFTFSDIVLLNPGEGFFFTMDFVASSTATFDSIKIDGRASVKFNAKNDPVDIDIIDPKVLLQRLVDNITERNDEYTTGIEGFNVFNNDMVMMAAAESIRGIERTNESDGAKVHTSFDKFTEWMKVFGYEEHVDKDSVVFRKREFSFRGDLTALELGVDECAGLKKYVDEDHLFSGVKIGYNRNYIENANVRFEFNGQHDYSTDLTSIENILELVSPYRADCYGIEFLSQERLKETTDNKSDKDLFLVNVSEHNDNYRTVKNVFKGNVLRSIETGIVNDTMFNGNINPYALLLRNLNLAGVSAKDLRFTASDSNAEIEIDGVAINQSVGIPEGTGLFDPIIYDIASRNIQRLPEGELMNGIVRFRYIDKSTGIIITYEGFIDEISKNPAWESETTWKLRKKKA